MAMAELREIKTNFEQKKLSALLEKTGLRKAENEVTLGLFDENENLIATGGYSNNIIKNVATDPNFESSGALSQIMTELIYRLKKQYENFFVFTKANKDMVFKSLGFNLIVKTDKVALLEYQKNGLESYLNSIGLDHQTLTTAIVMNANPFTKGHLALIKKAMEDKKPLIIFLVEEDASYFSTTHRYNMVLGALKEEGLENVTLIKGGPYVISKATFPTYFLKQSDDEGCEYAKLDATLFATKIAPKLNIKVRYVGTEPFDKATSLYNEELQKTSLEIKVMPRVEQISASKVRCLYQNDDFAALKNLVPPFTYRYLLCLKLAKIAKQSMIDEVSLTPKPGLVDKNNNGSHKDMCFDTFIKSTNAISPYLNQMATLAIIQNKKDLPSQIPQDLRQIGMQAERAMFEATLGVNTHKGAIFSLGLILYTCAIMINKGQSLEPLKILEALRAMTGTLSNELKDKNLSTNSSEVYKKYQVGGIREEAALGYPTVREALGFFEESQDLGKTLLFLITRCKDSNLYHRSDEKTVTWAKEKAQECLEGKLEPQELDKLFISKNLSPGGSADLLILVIFLSSHVLKCT